RAPKKRGVMPWIVGLIAIALLGGGAMMFLKKGDGGTTAAGGTQGLQFTASSEPWVDRMNDPVIPTKTSNGTRHGAGWRLDKLTKFYVPEVMTDGAVRLRCSVADDGTQSGIHLRCPSSTGPNSGDGYSLGFYKGVPSFQLHLDAKSTPLVKKVLHYP